MLLKEELQNVIDSTIVERLLKKLTSLSIPLNKNKPERELERIAYFEPLLFLSYVQYKNLDKKEIPKWDKILSNKKDIEKTAEVANCLKSYFGNSLGNGIIENLCLSFQTSKKSGIL